MFCKGLSWGEGSPQWCSGISPVGAEPCALGLTFQGPSVSHLANGSWSYDSKNQAQYCLTHSSLSLYPALCTSSPTLPDFFFPFWFLSHNSSAQGLPLTLNSGFFFLSWWGSEKHMQYQLSNPGQLHARQVFCLLYYHSGLYFEDF